MNLRGPVTLLLGVLCAGIGATTGQQPPAGQQPPGTAQQPPGGAAGRRRRRARKCDGHALHDHVRALSRHRSRRRPRANAFSERLLTSNDDETLAAKIRDGVPNTAMQPFKGTLDDQQIWQLVAYIRTHGREPEGQAGLRARSEQPDHQVREADVPDRSRRAGARDAVGPRLPSRRPPARDRTSAAACASSRRASSCPRPCRARRRYGSGRTRGCWTSRFIRSTPRTAGSISPTPRSSPATWRRRRAAAAAPPNRPRCRRRARQGTRRAAEPAVDDGLRPRQDRQDQSTGSRSSSSTARPSELYTPSGSHYGTRFLFDKDRPPVLQPRRARRHDQRAGSVQAARQDPSRQRRRVDSEGQPVREHAERAAVDLELRPSQPAGAGVGSVAGLLWESEHGPTGGDEINIIEKGKNYGWGVISMGMQNGITERSQDGMEQPIVYYTPTIAPSGIAFYTGSKYPGWKNNLFVAALAGQQLRRLEISGRKVVAPGSRVPAVRPRPRRDDRDPTACSMCCCRIRPGSGTGLGLAASTPGMVIRLVPPRNSRDTVRRVDDTHHESHTHRPRSRRHRRRRARRRDRRRRAPPRRRATSGRRRRSRWRSPSRLSPEEEMKTFSLPPGFRVELVASEPMIESPILMDFDRGRPAVGARDADVPARHVRAGLARAAQPRQRAGGHRTATARWTRRPCSPTSWRCRAR